MKRNWFKSEDHYLFCNTIQEAAYNKHFYEIFRDWLECVSISLQQSVRVYTSGELNELEEDKYKKIIRGYKYPEKFSQALGIMVEFLTKTQEPYDFLGEVFHSMEIHNGKGLGQFFTPACLSELMANLIMGNKTPQDLEHSAFNRMMLNEPTCGAGGMVIAGTKILRRNGWRNDQYYWVASDIDIRCVLMTYLQCTLLDIPCLVKWQNTLTLEHWKSFPTFALVRDPIYTRQDQIKIPA